MIDPKTMTALKTAPLKEVLSILEKSPFHMCVVIDHDEKVVGTITDGDIRRGFLDGLSITSEAASVMCSQPAFVFEGSSPDVIEKKFLETKIEKMLVLNHSFQLISILENKAIAPYASCDYPVVIMAGGKGTRLWPLTKDLPKPMIHIGGKPILEHIIDNLSKEGFREFYLSINYKADIIKDYFADGSHKNITIHYLEEKESLGTAGSLSLMPSTLQKPILIMNGDILCHIQFANLIRYHQAQKNDMTVGVREYSVDVPYGVIECDEHQKICSIKEKPRIDFHINSGIYVIQPSILSFLEKDHHIDMTDLISKVLRHGLNCSVFPLMETWVDIGQKDDLERAHRIMDTHQTSNRA